MNAINIKPTTIELAPARTAQISTLTWDGGWPHAALGTVGEAK